MFNFHKPTLSDYIKLKELFQKYQPESFEFTAGSIIGWSSCYDVEISCVDDCFVSKVVGENSFCVPFGKNRMQVFAEILDKYQNPSFFSVLETEKDEIESLYPGYFEFEDIRDEYEYVYKREELANLKGKSNHSKRNHISYFIKNNIWTYEIIDKNNIDDCISMYNEWYDANVDRDGIEVERVSFDLWIENYFDFDFTGALIRVDGKVIAFTFGEKINEKIFDTHIEKADINYRGAYQMINNQFALNSLQNYEFINREDDTGSLSLRKSKLSYHPEYLLKKYYAKYKKV